jgi:hypothetical protein
MHWIKKFFILFTISLLLLIGVGCTDQPVSEGTETDQHQTHSPSGDLRETTASRKDLPSFLKHYDSNVTKVYQIAAANADLLDWIPCYCGCGESADHKSSRECFLFDITKDGKVIWDDHGTRCGTCMNIAIEAALLKEKGKSHAEIRKYIDEKYQKGYAPPTPTPMPS